MVSDNLQLFSVQTSDSFQIIQINISGNGTLYPEDIKQIAVPVLPSAVGVFLYKIVAIIGHLHIDISVLLNALRFHLRKLKRGNVSTQIPNMLSKKLIDGILGKEP